MHAFYTPARLLLFFLISTIPVVCAAQTQKWNSLGPSDSNKASFARVSNDAIANYGNEPYVIFSDYSLGGRATVRKYAAQGWETVGAGISVGATNYNDIAIDNAGNVYAAFSDGGNGLKASVKKYSGGSWTTLGSASLSAGHALFIDIAISNTGTPYVAFVDTGIGNMAVVKKWDGASWIDVGTNGIVAPTGSWYLSLAIDNNGSPLVAYGNRANYNKLNVSRWDGASWSALGDADFSAGDAHDIRLILRKDGTPYVGFTDGGINRNVIMRLKSGASTWSPVGPPHFSYGIADIAFDRNDTLYEALCDTGNNYTLALRRYSDSIFTRVLVDDYVQMGSAHLLFDTTNRPLISTLNMWGPSQENVVRYNGGLWEDLAGLGLTGQRVGYSSMAVDSKGRPYVFSAGRGKTDQGVVRMYDGSSWVTVGAGPVTGPWLRYLSIAIDVHDVPFILYSEYYQRSKVKKFDGTDWVLVGDTTQLLIGDAPDLAVDTAGHPFISYSDAYLSGKPTVRKFDGADWVTVGAPGFEGNRVEHTSLAIDKSGTPYITYSNTLGYLDVTVKKFNGAAWVNVGAPGVSPDAASVPEIALDTAGLPYVIFKDDGNNGMARVRRFNGTSWQNVGSYVSSGTIRSCSLAIDSDNTVYAAYTDDEFNYETWVKQASVSMPVWSTLGNEAASYGMSGYYTNIAVKGGQPIVTWGNYGVYARQYSTVAIPNSVAQLSSAGMNLRLYPNPASGDAELAIHTSSAAPVVVCIYDFLGRSLYSHTFSAAEATRIQIPSDSYTPGMYLVSVRQANTSGSLRFVKQ